VRPATDFATFPRVGGMLSAPYDPSRPPEALDPLIDWADRFGGELVRLAEYPLSDLRGAVSAIARVLGEHVRAAPATGGALLAREHRRFLVSLDQLRWHLAIVEADDHGGHRQALGQYLRLVAEAARRHREDERRPGPGADREERARAPRPGPGNAK
jgi:hypothetical protein